MLYNITYTIPPLRANYHAEITASSEKEAIEELLKIKPNAKVQNIT